MTALKGGAAVNSGSPSNSWAQFLLGNPSRTGKAEQFTNPNSLRFSIWSMYVRDSWQVTRNLTVNYGLRWEYYPDLLARSLRCGRLRSGDSQHPHGGEGGVPRDTGVEDSKKGFAPRLGVAYRLGQKTVIRSGYGISIDPDNMRNQRNQYPSAVLSDYTPPNTYQFVSCVGVPNSDGAAQVKLSDGILLPSFPDIKVGVIKPSPTASPFTANFNRGYDQSWNVFVKREVSSTWVAEVEYATPAA